MESCSLEQKKVLYDISSTAFSANHGTPTTYFTLIKSYLGNAFSYSHFYRSPILFSLLWSLVFFFMITGGAPLQDILALSTQNINMDIVTFQNLDPNVTYVRIYIYLSFQSSHFFACKLTALIFVDHYVKALFCYTRRNWTWVMCKASWEATFQTWRRFRIPLWLRPGSTCKRNPI